MTKLRFASLVVIGLAACAHAPSPGVARSATGVSLLASLHASHWSDVGLREIYEIIPWRLTPVETGSGDATACDERFYEGDSAGEHIWIRLTPSMRDGKCEHYYLSSVSYWRDFAERAEAEAFRSSVIGALRAGGVPNIRDGRLDFLWRANDSQRYFNLYTNVFKQDGLFRASVRLLQTPTTPAGVDTLPFEAGFVPREE